MSGIEHAPPLPEIPVPPPARSLDVVFSSYGSIWWIETTDAPASRKMMSSGMRVFFIQKCSTRSSGKIANAVGASTCGCTASRSR